MLISYHLLSSYCKLHISDVAYSTVQVFVDDELCGEIMYIADQAVYELDCGDMTGSSVKVTLSGNVLTLCEVQVFGELEKKGKQKLFKFI